MRGGGEGEGDKRGGSAHREVEGEHHNAVVLHEHCCTTVVGPVMEQPSDCGPLLGVLAPR
jgi:hypothetical protein